MHVSRPQSSVTHHHAHLTRDAHIVDLFTFTLYPMYFIIVIMLSPVLIRSNTCKTASQVSQSFYFVHLLFRSVHNALLHIHWAPFSNQNIMMCSRRYYFTSFTKTSPCGPIAGLNCCTHTIYYNMHNGRSVQQPSKTGQLWCVRPKLLRTLETCAKCLDHFVPLERWTSFDMYKRNENP